MTALLNFCTENKLQMDYSPRWGEGTIYFPESIRLSFVCDKLLSNPINYTIMQHDTVIKVSATTEFDLINRLKKALS